MQLVRTDALLAGRDQKDRLQLQAQRHMTRLENGAHFDGERATTVVAFINANADTFARKFLVSLNTTAMRAYRATRSNTCFYEVVSGLLIVKLGLVKNGFAHVNSPTLKEL